jgi:PKD repeat protein
MIGHNPLAGEDRAATSTLSFVLAVGIVTVLTSGLLVATNDSLAGQRESAARDALEGVGQSLAADLVRADRATRDGGIASLRRHPPARIAGFDYRAELLTGSGCDAGPLIDGANTAACLRLTAPSPDVRVTVPVDNRSPVTMRTSPSGAVVMTAGTDAPTRYRDGSGRVDVRPNVGVGRGVDRRSERAISVDPSNRNPISGFTYAPGSPTAGETVRFRNDTSDLDGSIVSHEWDFDGDGAVDATGPTPTHRFDEAGRYDVTLTVTDDDGSTANATKTVPVSGLLYDRDAIAIDPNGNDRAGGIRFGVTNTFPDEEVVVTELLIDPENDDVDELDDDDDGYGRGEIELFVGGDRDAAGVDWNGMVTVPDDGLIVDVSDDGDANAGDARMSPGSTAAIDLVEFEADDDREFRMAGRPVTVGVRYEVDGENYVSTFRVVPDRPTAADVTVTAADDGGGIDADVTYDVVDPNGDLAGVTVELYDRTEETVDATRNVPVGGASAGGTVSLGTTGDGHEHVVRVTVTDEAGHTHTTTAPIEGSP